MNESLSLIEFLDMPDGEVTLYRDFFSADESQNLFQDLMDNTTWKQEQIQVPGKKVPLPRLTAWYGDAGKSYRYSGITVHPLPWTETLLKIKNRIQGVAGADFNSVLLNLYRSERDSVAWHSDDEPELGMNPVIASVSFGDTRNFQLKHKRRRELRREVLLSSGSLLVMGGATQHHWLHRIPKMTKAHEARINLTFRVIV